MHPWLIYLVSAYEGSSRMFGLFLAGLYIFFKLTDSVARVKEWLKTLEKLLSNVVSGNLQTEITSNITECGKFKLLIKYIFCV